MTNAIATATDKATKLQQGLRQFSGNGQWYRHWLPNCIYSDGIKYLMHEAQCYWLLDALFSFRRKVLANPATKDFCFWTLTLNDRSIAAKNGAKLQCWEDTDKKAFRICQEIPFTDFPLSTIKLYMSYDGRNILVYLPSEY